MLKPLAAEDQSSSMLSFSTVVVVYLYISDTASESSTTLCIVFTITHRTHHQ